MNTLPITRIHIRNRSDWAVIALLSSSIVLGACSSNSDDDKPVVNVGSTNAEIAIVATTAADFTSGAHASIKTTTPFEVTEDILPTTSDITLAAHGDYFYRIERFNSDNITKFAFDAPEKPLWQFSTLDAVEQGSGTPQDLVFLSDNKAYVPRWSKNTAWIVNPSATRGEDFKLGEIDLSAYDTGGDNVEMQSMAIVGDKLFIAMQRLDAGYAPQDAYVAVIDTNTDTEIDTKTGDTFKGILLPVKNPGDFQVDETGMLYIQGVGRYGFGEAAPEYTGGIAVIDPESFEAALLVDDGDAEEHPLGQISGMQIVSSSKGYLVSYLGFANAGVYAFNPVTGAVEENPLADLAGLDISGLAVDSNDRLWVGVSADAANGATIRLIDSADDTSVGEPINLSLNPTKVVFGGKAAQ